MPKAIVLGAGMVGSVMAADLAEDPDFQVAVADVRPQALRAAAARAKGEVATVEVDFADPEHLQRVVEPYDIVLGALPSAIAFGGLRAVIEAGKCFCDIAFMPEDPLELDEAARSRGVTAVVDCGVAPGMSNMLAGYADVTLDPCRRLAIYVGGLPRWPRPPFYYKAAFSPHDVIEEYTRPARVVEAGEIVEREPLGDSELIQFPGVGLLEACTTDGLRTLTRTLEVPFMVEKTLRYPGHAELMRALRAAGLFSREPVEVGGVSIRPVDLTAAIIFPHWTYGDGEEDLTVMRVVAEGLENGSPVRYQWDLVDRYDRRRGATSMARVTALPCTIVARLVAGGVFARPGVAAPEVIGRDPGMLERVLAALADRGIEYKRTVTKL
ncbi:MAG: saccharopine dehydrogenase family protein [Planctomycetota bacterium]|jgi:saccharopine dehydrogenase-like NADP-dependent oxidoreductase